MVPSITVPSTNAVLPSRIVSLVAVSPLDASSPDSSVPATPKIVTPDLILAAINCSLPEIV
jgi:hypothetical protein